MWPKPVILPDAAARVFMAPVISTITHALAMRMPMAFSWTAPTLSASLTAPLWLQAVMFRSLLASFRLLVKRRSPWRIPWRQLGTWSFTKFCVGRFCVGRWWVGRWWWWTLFVWRCPRLQWSPGLAAMRLAALPWSGPRLAASLIRGLLLFSLTFFLLVTIVSFV